MPRKAKDHHAVGQSAARNAHIYSVGCTDSQCAIMMAATVEHALMCYAKSITTDSTVVESAIKNGILGSIHNLATFLYILGKLSKGAYENCMNIGLIRNEFAHSDVELEFKEPVISELTSKLTKPIGVSVMCGFGLDRVTQITESTEGRDLFLFITFNIANTLAVKAHQSTRPAKMTDRHFYSHIKP